MESNNVFINTNNQNHIRWIYERMKNKHSENPDIDYMLKLKEICDWIDKNINEQKQIF